MTFFFFFPHCLAFGILAPNQEWNLCSLEWRWRLFFFFYSFLAALDHCCWAQVFSICGRWGCCLVVVHWLLTAVASLVLEHSSFRLADSVVADTLSSSRACGIFPDQEWNPGPLPWRWFLNHWTKREVPVITLKVHFVPKLLHVCLAA